LPERERERYRQRQRERAHTSGGGVEGEEGSPLSKEPDTGLDPRILGS